MTYPLIGNCGVNEEDSESARPWVEGFIVREYSEFPSNWRSKGTLREFLGKYNVLGIEGVDTRALTKHIRQAGAMKGIISTVDLNPKRLVQRAKDSPRLIGRDLVKEVTCKEKYTLHLSSLTHHSSLITHHSYRVLVVDFGVKRSILRLLVREGCQVEVVPASTSAGDILGANPDGILLSNGPGDPAGVPYAVKEVRNLIGKKPIFGISFGHQVLGRALGLETYKLKFGHRGANQPVKDLKTGKVEITVQNHGFCVKLNNSQLSTHHSSLDLVPTHINLNDGTLEGMEHRHLPIFSVQYHPAGLISKWVDEIMG
jgi:carbamoyl-phosphate synthase small subunit